MNKELMEKLNEYEQARSGVSVKNSMEELEAIKALKNEFLTMAADNNCKVATNPDGTLEIIEESKGTSIYGGNSNVNNNNFLNKANITEIFKNEENLNLGKYIRGSLTGDWKNAGAEMQQFKALSTGTGTVLIPQVLSAEILKAIMNKSLIYKSGVPIVNMPSGNITIAKVVNNPTYGFKEELAVATPGDATFEGVTLKGKMAYGLMKVSLEVLHSADNLESVLLDAMGDALADAIDKSMLYGVGTTDIKGLSTYAGINKVESSGSDYSSFINAVGKIRQKNGEPTTMAINSTIDTMLNSLADSTGQPLQAPDVVKGLNKVISNQLRSNLGTGTDENEAIVFDPKAMIVGQQVQFMFETSRNAGFTDGSVMLRVYSLLDMAVVRPEHITYISKLK